MTFSIRFKEKGITALLITLLFFTLAVYSYSANAQHVTVLQKGSDDQSHSATGKSALLVTPLSRELNAAPMHASLNSPYAELKPTLSPDGRRLYFSRLNHPDNTVGKTDSEDIWYSSFDKTSDAWSDPVRMTGLINNGGPNFINNVSMTGDTIILGNQYTKRGKMRAGLSYSVNINGEWTAPTSINIKNDYNMSKHANAFVSLRTGIIIQAIERGESVGGRDLYVSFWDGTNATEPVNMGDAINTNLEESSPFLASDNKTLYFASKGHSGFGGFDIYVTTRLDDTWANWSVPENLGASVNGEMDDEFFSISHCGNYAAFSKQVSVHNVDLFKISTEKLPGRKTTKPSAKDISIFAIL